MITTRAMKALEDRAIENGTSRLILMERAGSGAARIVREHVKTPAAKVLILAWHGNNGGDGFVLARFLRQFCNVHVWFIGDAEQLTPEAKKNYERLPTEMLIRSAYFNDYNIIIDALLGTGAKGPLKEPIKSLVVQWNASRAYKIALDIPSGIDPDIGPRKEYLHADQIITFHDTKPGLKKIKADVRIADIGL
jgi:NAD(P)H-hydrate epimerase